MRPVSAARGRATWPHPTFPTIASTVHLKKGAANPQSLLWLEMRRRSCQFLGPQVQDDLILMVVRAFNTIERWSLQLLINFVIHVLKKDYPSVSEKNVMGAINLLRYAGCFRLASCLPIRVLVHTSNVYLVEVAISTQLGSSSNAPTSNTRRCDYDTTLSSSRRARAWESR